MFEGDNVSSSGAVEKELRMAQQKKFKKESIIYGVPVKISKDAANNSKIMKSEMVGSVALQQNQQDRSFLDRFIINPDNSLLQVFNVVLILSALTSTLTSAYYACFGPPVEQWLKILDVTMEVLFLIGVLLSFLTEYQDEET